MAFKDVLSCAIILVLLPALAVGQLQSYSDPAGADGSVNFLVVGDWGRQGLFNQSQVATQMGVVGQSLGADFIIGTGDNFYENGITSVSDPTFKLSFTNIYTAASLQKNWYNVLGNRDYRGSVSAQISPALRGVDKRWYCHQNYKVSAGLADFFFIDTSPFVDQYFTNPGLPAGVQYDWSLVLPNRAAYLSSVLSNLDAALKSSTAKWKFVVGHHPVLSAGLLGPTDPLVQRLAPILQSNGVAMYLNGHDHNLQRFTSGGVEYITSGGGSQAYRGMGPWSKVGMSFYFDGQGFLSAKVTQAKADFVFYGLGAAPLYSWSLVK